MGVGGMKTEVEILRARADRALLANDRDELRECIIEAATKRFDQETVPAMRVYLGIMRERTK